MSKIQEQNKELAHQYQSLLQTAEILERKPIDTQRYTASVLQEYIKDKVSKVIGKYDQAKQRIFEYESEQVIECERQIYALDQDTNQFRQLRALWARVNELAIQFEQQLDSKVALPTTHECKQIQVLGLALKQMQYQQRALQACR